MAEKKSIRLSDSQFEAMKWCYEHGGHLVHWPGGFWTVVGIDSVPRDKSVPAWSCGTNTVRSLERLGMLVREMAPGRPEWADGRLITNAGIERVRLGRLP